MNESVKDILSALEFLGDKKVIIHNGLDGLDISEAQELGLMDKTAIEFNVYMTKGNCRVDIYI